MMKYSGLVLCSYSATDLNAEAVVKERGTFCALTKREDVVKVLEHPELVIRGNADAIWQLTGVNTSVKCLQQLRTRVNQQSLCNQIISDQTSDNLCKRLTDVASSNVPREGKKSTPFVSQQPQVGSLPRTLRCALA
jgi:hypothetical protein